jgi:putative hemolysin
MFLELGIVAALILVNGALAMSELAIVSASRVRLALLADQRKAGARAALQLADNPGRFLSTVQIGITLVGVLAGAFSGATLGYRLSQSLDALGIDKEVAEFFGVGAVVVVITYFSLVIGELVPKQLALRSPEAVSCRIAPSMLLLSRIAAPLVWLLDTSGNLVLRMLGSGHVPGSTVTEDEIRAILAEGERAGVLKVGERDMLTGVMRLADRSARALMTPRREVEIFDLSLPAAELVSQLRTTRRTRLPVRDGDEDSILGVISVKATLSALDGREDLDFRQLAQDAPVVMDVSNAITVIDRLRTSILHIVLVFDELGHFEGVITALDVLEAITGSFPDEDQEGPLFTMRADGSYLVSGSMPVDEFLDLLGIPQATDGKYATVAGLVLDRIGHLPKPGESVEHAGWLLEVIDLDRTRIDTLLVQRAPASPDE